MSQNQESVTTTQIFNSAILLLVICVLFTIGTISIKSIFELKTIDILKIKPRSNCPQINDDGQFKMLLKNTQKIDLHCYDPVIPQYYVVNLSNQ